jgi:hypothetical protein
VIQTMPTCGCRGAAIPPTHLPAISQWLAPGSACRRMCRRSERLASVSFLPRNPLDRQVRLCCAGDLTFLAIPCIILVDANDSHLHLQWLSLIEPVGLSRLHPGGPASGGAELWTWPIIVNLRDARLALGRGEASKILADRLKGGDNGR